MNAVHPPSWGGNVPRCLAAQRQKHGIKGLLKLLKLQVVANVCVALKHHPLLLKHLDALGHNLLVEFVIRDAISKQAPGA